MTTSLANHRADLTLSAWLSKGSHGARVRPVPGACLGSGCHVNGVGRSQELRAAASLVVTGEAGGGGTYSEFF